MNRARRPSRAQLDRAYALSAQGAFEIARRDFSGLRRDALRRGDCLEAGHRAIEAGERRVAEVAGTEFEAGWRDAVASLRTQVAALEAN